MRAHDTFGDSILRFEEWLQTGEESLLDAI